MLEGVRCPFRAPQIIRSIVVFFETAPNAKQPYPTVVAVGVSAWAVGTDSGPAPRCASVASAGPVGCRPGAGRRAIPDIMTRSGQCVSATVRLRLLSRGGYLRTSDRACICSHARFTDRRGGAGWVGRHCGHGSDDRAWPPRHLPRQNRRPRNPTKLWSVFRGCLPGRVDNSSISPVAAVTAAAPVRLSLPIRGIPRGLSIMADVGEHGSEHFWESRSFSTGRDCGRQCF